MSMAALTKTIAMDIVDQTMRIMNYNINVMDENGVIIGTGNRKRLGQIHEGALQVIKENRKITIKPEEMDRYTGAQPGINLPILMEGAIVGVIGISGNPYEISQFGELVKMGAELTLKQAALTEQLQWDKRLQEELVHEIIHNKVDQYSFERVQRMGIDLEITRLPILITFDTAMMNEASIAKHKQNSLNYLSDRLDKDDLIASIDRNKMIILKVHPDHKVINSTLDTIKRTLNQLHLRTKCKWYAGVGMTFSLIKDANRAYQYADDALKAGRILHPSKRVFFYEEWQLPILITRLGPSQTGMLTEFKLLREYDRNGELQKTLQAYIEENMEQAVIAKKLFIHRNTLRYRLEKIKEITGKDPRNINDLFTLHVSQLVYQLDL